MPAPTNVPSTRTGADKRRLGSYYTVGNPFALPAFTQWLAAVPADAALLEPFAGSGQIPRLLDDAGHHRDWALFDADPDLPGVTHQDTLATFPAGYRAVITNPPYLSAHVAKRAGITVDPATFNGWPSLYLTAAAIALDASPFVAMIVPESFITARVLTDRLEAVVSLPMPMFDDTEMPSCLALWGPHTGPDYQLWTLGTLLGDASALLTPPAPTPCAPRIRFNDPAGQIGFRGVDNTRAPSIEFGPAALCPPDKVKPSGRHLTRISVAGLTDPDPVTDLSNGLLDDWRTRTADTALTAFMGRRTDGKFRRRLDYAAARALLSQALCAAEDHPHPAAAGTVAAA